MEAIKKFFKELWEAAKPVLKTAFTLGINWLLNYIKNKIGYKEYSQSQVVTQSEPMSYKNWQRTSGYPNCIQKYKTYKQKRDYWK